MKSEFSNIVARNGFIYGLDDGILACVEAATGDRKWKDGRYGHGQLILADDLLLVQTEQGPIALVEANPAAYREVARLSGLSAKTWNTPALAGEFLLIRNDQVQGLELGAEVSLNACDGQPPAVEAAIVFVGYGMAIPEAHYDDLAGLDLRGKIAVYINATATIRKRFAIDCRSGFPRCRSGPHSRATERERGAPRHRRTHSRVCKTKGCCESGKIGARMPTPRERC